MIAARSHLSRHPCAKTMNLTIPADIVKDSQYPFPIKNEVEVWIIIDPEKKRLIIERADQ